MAQITNLNVSPYYDDFDKTDNFNRVLFRPGFAVQARELTTLQSIFQDQIETHGSHIFKEGTVVVPGQISYSNAYYSLKLESTFGGEDIVPSQYYNETNPVILTGATSGVKGKVVGYQDGTSTTNPYLFLQPVQAGSDNVQLVATNGESLIADKTITHTTTYASGVASLTAFNETEEIPARGEETGTTGIKSCTQTGSAVTVEDGIYYIRGQFVRVYKQTLVLSVDSVSESARIGFTITEDLVTPETDITLTDNATGSSNYAAKGAHRLKITLTLAKLPIGSAEDTSFVEVMQLKNGGVIKNARATEYSVIGKEFARRTFDESGDYTVRPFTFDVREAIDNDYKAKTYKGVYGSGAVDTATDDGFVASEDLLSLVVSPGKAYVKGYEIEKISSTFLDLNKARLFNTVDSSISTFNVGNFVRITNMYGMPDISNITGETTPYKEIQLFNLATSTRGSTSGRMIGVARARTLEHEIGTQGATDSQSKLYLFDLRMFTILTLSDTPSPTLIATHTTGGVQIKGATSGATGFVFGSQTSGTKVTLTNVVGTFQNGEKLIASDSAETGKLIENSGNTDIIIEASNIEAPITTHSFAEVKQVFMDDPDTGEDFTADVVLSNIDSDAKAVIDRTDANDADKDDKLLNEDGSSFVGLEPLREARLIEPEKNISLFKLPNRIIKTLLTNDNDGASDTQFTVRRQFVGTTNSSGVVSFTAGSNETFSSFTASDFALTVLSAGGGSAAAGDHILLNSTKVTGGGTSTLTITDSTLLGSSAKVKIMATILRTSVAIKTKTTNLSKQLKVLASDADGAYGTRATDAEISLGRADVFKLQAVFDSESTSTDATAPEFTISSVVGTFTRGEKITGGSSGAVGRVISTTSPMSYVLVGGFGATDFIAAETITGASSGATATVGTLTAGSKVITSNFVLDTGQRDNYYDIARIVKKSSASVPLGRLLVVYDFLSHGAGDVFTVDSYSGIGGQMQYDDIPVYTATKVDPDQTEPTGSFELRDSYDFRPTVEDITGASSALSVVDQITSSSFDFANRQFDGTGASTVNFPKPASNLQCDFEYYIPYRATLFMTSKGEFRIFYGTSSDDPLPPKDIQDGLKLATMFIPAYTFSPDQVEVNRYKTQRFTMRDIGKLKNRIEKLEDVTSLTLLENQAQAFEIQDQNGLNRFKSGFIVDNFTGHTVAAAQNKDYKAAVDIQKRELRPKCVMRNIDLIESVSTDAARAAAGYQRTGDLITLPYTEEAFINQPYGTRVENVQPYMTSQWVGRIELKPSGDEWFETEIAPTVTKNVDGNYDTVLANNQNSLGTFWNAWEVFGVGSSTENLGQEWVTTTSGSTGQQQDLVKSTREVVKTTKVRTGIETTITEDIVFTSGKSKSTALLPYVRPRNVVFDGQCFMPNVRVYAFFDGVDVNAFVTPKNEFYTSDTTIVAGSPLITTAAGRVEGTFAIPDYKFADQTGVPRFKTGEIEFRLTMSDTNKRIGYGGVTVQTPSAGQAVYNAVGILETTTETITGTRNAKIVQTNVDEKTVIEDKGEVSKETVDSRFVAVNNSDNGGSVYHGSGDDYAGGGSLYDAHRGIASPARTRSGIGVSPAAAGETGGGGKIICTALHQMGLLPYDIFAADQEYGRQLAKTHPDIVKGYHIWANVVVDWMNGVSTAPNIMPWVKDNNERIERTANWATRWSQAIATPWAIQMAHEMGIREKGSKLGKFLMYVGYPISAYVSKRNKVSTIGMLSIFALLRFVVMFSEKYEFNDNMIVEKK